MSSSIHQFASGALHAEDQSGNPTPFPVIGTQQSPIVIGPDDAIAAHYGNDYIEFNLEAELTGTYDGENFKFTTPSQGGAIWGIRVDGEPWHIRKNTHMHDHVEHVVTGASDQHFECHLLHSRPDDEDAASDKLVIGVFFKLSEKAKRRDWIYRLNEKMKANRKADGKPECVGVSGELKPTDFLPDTREQRATWFHYMGSLTSAPFSENVQLVCDPRRD